MIIPGVVAQQQLLSLGGGAPLWTPLDMAVVPQIYLDMQDSTVTDVSGAASAISNLGAMGSDGDFSQGTSGNRPSILDAELNGNRVLRFDGTDDRLLGSTSAQKALLRNVSAGWSFVVYKKRTTDIPALFRYMIHAPAATTSTYRYALLAGSGTTAGRPRLLAIRQDGDSVGLVDSTTAYVNSYTMLLGAVNYSSRVGRLYVNGAVSAENSTITTSGNTSNTDSFTHLAIGGTGQANNFADVDIAVVLMSNTAPSDSDIDKLFGWAAHKYGLTASLPGGHPYKTTPPYA